MRRGLTSPHHGLSARDLKHCSQQQTPQCTNSHRDEEELPAVDDITEAVQNLLEDRQALQLDLQQQQLAFQQALEQRTALGYRADVQAALQEAVEKLEKLLGPAPNQVSRCSHPSCVAILQPEYCERLITTTCHLQLVCQKRVCAMRPCCCIHSLANTTHSILESQIATSSEPDCHLTQCSSLSDNLN